RSCSTTESWMPRVSPEPDTVASRRTRRSSFPEFETSCWPSPHGWLPGSSFRSSSCRCRSLTTTVCDRQGLTPDLLLAFEHPAFVEAERRVVAPARDFDRDGAPAALPLEKGIRDLQ